MVNKVKENNDEIKDLGSFKKKCLNHLSKNNYSYKLYEWSLREVNSC